MSSTDRRTFLQTASMAGLFSAVSPEALSQASGGGTVAQEKAKTPEIAAKHSLRFAVIGLDHAHIYSMTSAVQRGGGKLVAMYATDQKQIAEYRAKFGDVKLARSEDEILEDKSIQLVLSASIPDLRAPLGVKVMRAGKDYLADKPGITSLEQLAEVRRAVTETGRKFAVMYSERLEVRSAVYAGELIKQGAIGRVIQTINLGPHRTNAPSRPAWFFDKARYGGILTDIGSHQADQ
ncbi:MAG: Gfo/Idh/MocA family oxidoreductase, partial [Steroidobacter sp.]